MVNFALKTALSDDDQKDIAVTGAGPGVFLLLTFPPCCGSGGQKAAAASGHVGHGAAITFPDCWSQMTSQPAAACRRNFQNLVNCLHTPHSVSWLWTRQMVALNKTCSKEMVFMSPTSDTFSIFS